MPPSAFWNWPDPRLHARGHALLDAEQLAFQQGFRQRGAVQGHERAARARAGVVDGLGDQFLARAALAGDQHIDQAVADALHQADHLLDPLARADDAVGGVLALHLAPQMRVLLRQLILAAPQLADQLGGFDGDGGVRCQRRQRILVARRRNAPTRLFSASNAPMMSPVWLRTATASTLRVR